MTPAGGPEYERPELPAKEGWSQLEGRELDPAEVIRPDWWKGFGDPYLNALIAQALESNPELEVAALRLEQAGIDLKNERRSLLPEVGANPRAQVTGSDETSGTTVSRELLGLDVSWEIDLWGKLRERLAAQRASYAASEMDWRGTYLKLVADVATRYFRIRQLDEQIHHQREALANSEELLAIYEAQFGEGLVAETQLLNQRSEVESLATQVLESERQRDEDELKLARLLGRPAGEFEVPVAHLRNTVKPLEVPLMLPGDVLARRPDVLQAELAVLRAHHLLGEARLARLPNLNFTSGFGMAKLVSASWTWGLATSLAGMFDRDTRVQVETNEVTVRETVTAYREKVLTAYEEVEIALLNLRSRREQMARLERQIEMLQVVRDVQRERLKEGLVSQLELFETERSLLGSQQSLLQAYQQVLADTVTLYMALGGGWSAREDRGLAASN